MAFSVVGFHAGLGGNRNGIGDYFKALDDAGIPFSIKSIADAGLCMEAAQYARASGVPHSIIMRWTDYPGMNDDHPDLTLPPDEAAEKLWNGFLVRWNNAPELHEFADIVWYEPTNEVDTNANAEFLGWFSYYLAQLALRDGIKVCLSGHNAGQPDKDDWLLPGFSKWLQLASANPDKLAVSVHEGKLPYTTSSGEILNMDSPVYKFYPFLVGRYTQLFEVCDYVLEIPRPTVFVSEWAWSPTEMVPQAPAMEDIKWISEDAAKYDAVKGIFLWNLSGGWGDLPNQLQKMIVPVTTLALTTRYPDPEPPTIPPDPDPDPDPLGQVVYFLKPADLTPEETLTVDVWAKEGYVLPDGTKTYGLHTEAFSHTDAIRNVEWGNDDSLLLVVAGSRIGDGLDQDWLDQNAPGVADRAVFVEFPSTSPPIEPPLGDPGIGLHASTTSTISEQEFQEFRDLEPEFITVMSGQHNPNDINRLAGEHPDAEIVVRIFYEFGGRDISPQKFVNDSIYELGRVLGFIGYRQPLIQIGNEPNLYAEGLGSSWQDGAEFNIWYLETIRLLRAHFPHQRYGFPGLSPGGDHPGIRMDSTTFLRECKDAVLASQALCVHTYFAPQFGFSMSTSVNEVAAISDIYPTMDIVITECANNRENATPETKAVEYAVFVGMLSIVPKVLGVTYFVASSTTIEWTWDKVVGTGQTWVDVGMAAQVRAALDSLG